MFINRAPDGKNNICGANVARLRKSMGISQRELAQRLQIAGLDIEKNGIQRIESGSRFVTDIELGFLSKVLASDINELLQRDFTQTDLNSPERRISKTDAEFGS